MPIKAQRNQYVPAGRAADAGRAALAATMIVLDDTYLP